jgi:hypothetical protein
MLDSHDTSRRLNKLVPHAIVTVVPVAGHALTDDGESIYRFSPANSTVDAEPTGSH